MTEENPFDSNNGSGSSNSNGHVAAPTFNNQLVDLTPVVSPRNWKRKAQDGEWYTLPAANEPAKLRRPSFTTLAAKVGMIPNRLASEVMDLLADLGAYRNRAPSEQLEAFQKNARAFVLIARECFVEPRLITDLRCQRCQNVYDYTARECPGCRQQGQLLLIEPDYDNGEISPLDIPDFDYTWLAFSFVEGSEARVAEFRYKQPGRDGEIAPRSENLRSIASPIG